MKQRKKFIGCLLSLAVLIVAGWWWNEHRHETIREAINPFYWVRRWRGQDLYDPRTRVIYHGNRALKEIALTIDDGPHEPTGRQLLDIFKSRGIHATFFVVGMRMKEQPDLLRRMIAEGHEVGDHTQNHRHLDGLTAEQVQREMLWNDINFNRITGRHFNLFRPPGMRYDDNVLAVSKRRGYVMVSWNSAARDFENVSADFIYRRVMDRVENGSIILLHDDNPNTVEAMPRLLDSLRARGYRFVTISEMLAHLPVQVTPGKSGMNTH